MLHQNGRFCTAAVTLPVGHAGAPIGYVRASTMDSSHTK